MGELHQTDHRAMTGGEGRWMERAIVLNGELVCRFSSDEVFHNSVKYELLLSRSYVKCRVELKRFCVF